jgi:hypothetical protein
MLWVLGFALSLCGLFVWLEFGTMFPRSGGEKVYLEAVYRRPKQLVTVIFAVNAVMLNFSSGNCIVSVLSSVSSVPAKYFSCRFSPRSTSLMLVLDACVYLLLGITPISILVSAGHRAELWVVRGIAIGGMCLTFFLEFSLR